MNLLTTPPQRAPANIFFGCRTCSKQVSFEGVAEPESLVGIFPGPAAHAIAAKCRAELFDLKELRPNLRQFRFTIKQLTPRRQRDKASRFVHWGATSQDVIDTATVRSAAPSN
jgi:3-carboxy-cis,cis-muconate cycloisomerase